jgi:hypothetical protein
MSGGRVAGWPARVMRQLRRVTHRPAVHTLFVDAGGARAWRPAAQADAAASGAHSTWHSSAAEWCAAHPGQAADVVVSGHLLFSLHVSPALPLADAPALRAYALQQFGHYHGSQAQAWPLAVWPDARQRVACALHGIDLPALRAQAEAHGVHLRCMLPAWAVALQAARHQVPALAGGRRAVVLVEGTLVTWMALDDGTLVALRERFLDTPSAASLCSLLAELNADVNADVSADHNEGSAPCGPFDQPPVVLGYGLTDTLAAPIDAASFAFQTLGSLADGAPAGQWVVAGAGARP